MFRLITHVITFNVSQSRPATSGTPPHYGGHRAVSSDVIETEYATLEQIETAKTAFNALEKGIGGSSNYVGVSVRHVVLTL